MSRASNSTSARAEPESRTLRVCLDLNVWVANLFAAERRRGGTAARTCIAAVQDGRCVLGYVHLVVPWGMLTRLRVVLEEKLTIPREVTEPYLARDRGDCERGHTRRAGVIVTGNFADFVSYGTEVLRAGRVALIAHAGGRVLVAHPAAFAGWVRGGEVPAEAWAGGV